MAGEAVEFRRVLEQSTVAAPAHGEDDLFDRGHDGVESRAAAGFKSCQGFGGIASTAAFGSESFICFPQGLKPLIVLVRQRHD